LPVLVADGISMNLLPPELAKIQYVEYRKRDRNTAFALAKAITNLPPAKPLPDPLPLPPEVPRFPKPRRRRGFFEKLLINLGGTFGGAIFFGTAGSTIGHGSEGWELGAFLGFVASFCFLAFELMDLD
jgi:hypothetical protein